MSNLKCEHEEENVNLEIKKKELAGNMSEEEQLTLFADIISNYIIKVIIPQHEE